MKYIATGIISPFHLYSSLGALFKLSDKINKSSYDAEIHIMKNFNDEYLIKKINNNNLSIVDNRYKFKITDLLILLLKFSIVLVFFKSKKNNFIAHHTYFNIRDLSYFTIEQCFNLGIVIFEEGTGSYNTIRKAVKIARRERLKFPFLRTILKWIFSHIYHYKFTVLIKNDNLNYFNKAIEYDINNKLTKEYEIKGFEKLLFDDYRFKEISTEELKFMAKKNIAVKPHPATDLKFYSDKIQIIDSKVSAEKILFKENIKEIYVKNSTVGVFVKNNLNNINVVNVGF